MLKELITANCIQAANSAPDWKAAIRLAAAPLVKDGSIDELEPYIVLGDHFAVPHARVGQGSTNVIM